MKWHNETRNVLDLIPADYNPRQMTENQAKSLRKSLERFDPADPIIVNTNNTIIGGHQRIRILADLGIKEVDVRVPDKELTENEEKELNIRLNQNKGEFDFDALANNFEIDFLKNAGFEGKDLDKIIGKQDHSKDDEFDIEEKAPQSTGMVKSGDVWQLGEHRLICGDSTDLQTYKNLLGPERAKLVFTDPSYNIGYAGGMNTHGQNKREMIKNDKMSKGDFYSFLDSFIKASKISV